MADSIALQLAETVQTASIQHNPSAERDLAPSTAADTKVPVAIQSRGEDEEEFDDPLGLDDDDDDEDEEDDDDEANYSVIRPWDPVVDGAQHRFGRHRSHDKEGLEAAHGWASVVPHRPHNQLPPMPDLRFEQSYLRSLSGADTWWKVALVTVRDQVVLPFAQGLLYNVAVCGWQFWNRTATLNGQSAGARVRRWWYGVNNWQIPGTAALSAAASTAKRPAIRR